MIKVWYLKNIWDVVTPMTEQEFMYNALNVPRKLIKISNRGHIKEVNYFAVTSHREVV